MSDERFLSIDFELAGKVQGVAMNPYTLEEANQIGIVGKMMNTEKGIIRGTIQGSRAQIQKMKHYLSCVGTPYSTIDKAVFFNEHELVHKEYSKFTINPTNW